MTILLLALRGLVGEAMAGQMLQQHLAEPVQLAQDASQPAAHEDCLGHAGQPEEAPASAFHDCRTCATCQVCSSVALGVTAPPPAALRLPQSPPGLPQPGWQDADRTSAFKPPIS